MRIKNMIIQGQFSCQCYFDNLLLTTPLINLWGQERRVCILILGIKGLILTIVPGTISGLCEFL